MKDTVFFAACFYIGILFFGFSFNSLYIFNKSYALLDTSDSKYINNPNTPLNKEIQFKKSFKNDTGHYQINGDFKNLHSFISADIKVTKYFKTQLSNNTVFVCSIDKQENCYFDIN